MKLHLARYLKKGRRENIRAGRHPWLLLLVLKRSVVAAARSVGAPAHLLRAHIFGAPPARRRSSA